MNIFTLMRHAKPTPSASYGPTLVEDIDNEEQGAYPEHLSK